MRQQGNPNSGFLLERRSRTAGAKTGSAATKAKQGRGDEPVGDNDIRPLGPDAFIEVLNRYCRRFLRDGKNFSLASLRILEYDRVKSTAGGELADKLDRLGAGIVCSALRGEDRICFVGPAQYLVLMPGTVYDDAHRAMERAALTIGEKSLRQKSHIVRPSASFVVTSPSNSSCTSGDTDTVAATETLLGDVGYAIGAHHELIDRLLEHRTDSGGTCRVFAGSYEAWFERYRRAGERLIDTWSPGDLEVELTVWEPSSDTESGVNHEALLRRLRALQAIEHPAFNRITDFYIAADWKVSFIAPKVGGVVLKAGAAGKINRKSVTEGLKDTSDLTILNWAIQICNALIAAQAVAPSLVLSAFSKIRVALTPEDRIVLSDFEAEYLQTSFDELASPDRKVKKTNGFVAEFGQFCLELLQLKDDACTGSRAKSKPDKKAKSDKHDGEQKQSDLKSKTNLTARSDAPLYEFRELLSTLAEHHETGEKFSLYKLRSTLKAIQETSA